LAFPETNPTDGEVRQAQQLISQNQVKRINNAQTAAGQTTASKSTTRTSLQQQHTHIQGDIPTPYLRGMLSIHMQYNNKNYPA
jgi:ubiquitin-protein ligase